MILEDAWVLDNVRPNGDSQSVDKSSASMFSLLKKEASNFENEKCKKCQYYNSCCQVLQGQT